VSERTAADAADTDVPTCSLHDDLETIRARARANGWDQCVIVNEEGIVLGRLGGKALGASDSLTVEEAMSEGPATVRPNVGVTELDERLERRGLRSILVTTSEGRLVGVVRRGSSLAAG
jgi:CBS domain-containing protein